MFNKYSNNSNFIISILVLGIFGILSTELGFIGILPQVAIFFNISVDLASLFISCFSLVIAIFSLFIPVVVSGYNRRYVLISVLLVMSIFSFIGGLVDNFYLALICRIIPAFFYPAYTSLAFTVAGEIVPSCDAPRSVSKIVMGVSLGSVLGVPISSFFVNIGGYPLVMFWFGCINLLSLIVTILFFPSMPSCVDSSFSSQMRNVNWNIFLVSAIGVIVLSTGFTVYYSYASVFLQYVSGIVGSKLTLTLFVFGFMSIPGSWLAGKLLTKYPNYTMLIFPLFLCGVLGLLYFLCRNMLCTILLVAIVGLCDGIFNNVIQYWILSSAPSVPEFANGVFMSMLNIGITIGTYIGGVMVIRSGYLSIFYGAISITILSVIFIAYRMIKYHNY